MEPEEHFGGCRYDNAADAQDRPPVCSPVNGSRRSMHHLLRSSSTFNSSFFQQPGGYTPAPFPSYNGSVGPSADHMLSSLFENQGKMIKMDQDISKRLGDLENIVCDLADKASDSVGPSSCSPEGKKRFPPQFISMCVHDLL